MLPNALRWLRTLFISIPLIVLTTIVATSLGIGASLISPQSAVLQGIKSLWARWVLAAAFVRLTVTGRERISSGHTLLYCANHLSYLDPPALIIALGPAVRFLAKESLFGVPFLGWAMRRDGDIPIPRDNPRGAARSLARAAQTARRGTSLVVFPEGGRSRDGTLQTFLSGAFRLAIEAHIAVVPVAIRGTHEALRPGSLFLPGGNVHIAIGEPIPTGGLMAKDQEELSLRVEAAIRAMLE